VNSCLTAFQTGIIHIKTITRRAIHFQPSGTIPYSLFYHLSSISYPQLSIRPISVVIQIVNADF